MKIIVYFALLLLLLSCGLNKSKKTSLVSSSSIENESKCKNVDFHQNPLDKKSLLSLFSCVKWDEKYPSLNQFLQNLDDNDWSKLVNAFHVLYFKNSSETKKLNHLLTLYRNNNTFVDIQKILEIVLKDNRVMSVFANILSSDKNENVINALQLLNVRGVNKDDSHSMTPKILAILGKHQKSLKLILNEDDKEMYVKQSEMIVSSLAHSVLKTESRAENQNMLAQYLYSDKLQQNIFRTWAKDSVRYEGVLNFYQLLTNNHELFQSDLKIILDSKDSEIECLSLNNQFPFKVSPKHELNFKIDEISNTDFENYWATLVDSLAKTVSFLNFCGRSEYRPDIERYTQANYHFLQRLSDFSRDEGNFILLKKLQNLVSENSNDKWWNIKFIASQPFSDLLGLLKISLIDRDDESLIKLYFDLLTELTDDHYAELSHYLKVDLTKGDTSYVIALARIWQSLGKEEKEVLLNVVFDFLSSDLNFSGLANSLQSHHTLFPNGVSIFQDFLFQDNGKALLRVLTNASIDLTATNLRGDVLEFFNQDNFFKLLTFLLPTQKGESNNNSGETILIDPILKAPEVPSLDPKVKIWVNCYDQLLKNIQQFDYYQSVNSLPGQCQNTIKKSGLAGSIFEWMYISNNLFEKRYGYTLHTANGLWSPSMLHFIFGYATIVGHVYQEQFNNSKYELVYDELAKNINDPAKRKNIIKGFSVFSTVVQNSKIIEQMMADFADSDPAAVLSAANAFINLPKTQLLASSTQKINCEKFYGLPEEKRCFDNDFLLSRLNGIHDLLTSSRDGSRYNLVNGLISLLHPDLGIELSGPNKKVNFKPEDLVRFLFDLSNEKTKKKYFYHSNDGIKELNGTALDRLQVLISDIGFSENYFGAYFKNLSSSANNYQRKIYQMQTVMNLMENSKGLLRRLNYIPKDSFHALTNVRNTYLALAEVDDSYQFDDRLSPKRFGLLVQGLLTVLKESSSLRAQNLSALKKPNISLAKEHNGRFLTYASDLNAMSYLSSYLRQSWGGDEFSLLNHSSLKKINSNFMKNVDPVKLEKLMMIFLNLKTGDRKTWWIHTVEKYLNTNTSLSQQDLYLIEQIFVESLVFVSDERLKKESVSSAMDFLAKWLPEIIKVNVSFQIGNQTSVLESVLKYIKSINNSDHSYKIYKSLNYGLSLLQYLNFNNNTLQHLADWFIEFSQLPETKPSPILDSFTKAVSDPRFTLEPLHQLVKNLVLEDRVYEVTDVLNFLSLENDGQNHLDIVLEELFVNSKNQIHEFLKHTYHSLAIPIDSNP